jgi:prepilin-type N-terminal cleavage/methylation domain-containing protein
MKKRLFRARGGFTLIEVATGVVIVATLTAAVVPVVVSQIDSAEPTRAGGDLASIAQGIETFHLNLNPAYPSDLYQLVKVPTALSTGVSKQMDGNEYLAKHAAAWIGPYISSNITSAASTLTTGFDATISTQLYWVKSAATWDNTNPVAGGVTKPSGADFIALKITNLTENEFERLDEILDGSISSTTGRFRYFLVSSAVNAYYFAVPYVD